MKTLLTALGRVALRAPELLLLLSLLLLIWLSSPNEF